MIARMVLAVLFVAAVPVNAADNLFLPYSAWWKYGENTRLLEYSTESFTVKQEFGEGIPGIAEMHPRLLNEPREEGYPEWAVHIAIEDTRVAITRPYLDSHKDSSQTPTSFRQHKGDIVIFPRSSWLPSPVLSITLLDDFGGSDDAEDSEKGGIGVPISISYQPTFLRNLFFGGSAITFSGGTRPLSPTDYYLSINYTVPFSLK